MEGGEKRQRVDCGGESFGVALVGHGSMGKIFSDVIQQTGVVRVLWVVGSKESADLSAVAARHEGARATASLQEALSDARVQGVVIASPSAAHALQVLAALRASKRTLCEKPLSLTVDECVRCYECAKERGVPLYVGLQRRLDEHFVRAKERVVAGEIGRVELVRVISRDPPSSSRRSACGIVFDSLVHDFDLACWFADECEPIECRMVMHQRDDRSSTSAAAVKFRNGVLALIVYEQGISYGYEQRMEIHGQNGSISVNNVNRSFVSLHKGGGSREETRSDQLYDFYGSRYRDAYLAELEVLAGKRSSAAKVPDHTNAHRCCEMAMASLQLQDYIARPIGLQTEIPFPLSIQTVPVHERPARIALIGAGRIGSIRARHILYSSSLQLKYVIDLRPQVARDLVSALGSRAKDIVVEGRFTPSIAAQVDGVWISTSTGEHLDVIRVALEAKKHVYCEKPIALLRSEILQAYTLQQNTLLSCAFQRRVDPHFVQGVELVRSITAGSPCSVVTINGDHPLPQLEQLKSLGSIFHDLLVHDLDYARFVLQVGHEGGEFESFPSIASCYVVFWLYFSVSEFPFLFFFF